MIFEHAHTLFHCVQNDLGASLIILLSAGVLIWYCLIAAIPWRLAVRDNEGHGRRTILIMLYIFLFCGACSYLSAVLSGWWPDLAYSLRVVFLSILNLLCPTFLIWSRHHRFDLVSRYSKFGAAAEAILDSAKAGPAATEELSAELLATLRQAKDQLLR